MITVQLSFHEQTIVDAITAAMAQKVSFNDYVEQLVNVDLDAAVEQAPKVEEPEKTVNELAKALFDIALEQLAAESDIDFDEPGTEYVVEDLYKILRPSKIWNLQDRGNRIMLGKAFRRLVDAQHNNGCVLESGMAVKVVFEGKTAQNKAIYKTVRTG